MKFEREALVSTLMDARPALPKKEGITPEFSHFWFDQKYVYANNGGLGVRLELATELDCGVPGTTLLDLLKTSALKEVFLDQTDDTVVLQMGKSKYPLVSLPSDRRPWLYPEPPKKADQVLTLSERIMVALRQIDFLRVKPETQVVHHGITVYPRKSWLEFYTTDTVGVAQAIVRERPGTLPRFVLPWDFIERVLTLIEPGASLHVRDDCLSVSSKGAMICSNMLELPEHPDLAKVVERGLPEGDPIELPQGLQQMVERACILAGAKEPLLAFTSKGTSLQVTGKYDLGSLDEKITLKAKLPAISAKFGADKIGLGLANADSFLFSDKALAFYGGEDFLYITSSKGGK